MLRPHLTATTPAFMPAGTTGKIVGYVVAAHSSGTIKAWDGPVASGSEYIHDTYTFATGSQIIIFPRPLPFNNGCSFTLGGSGNIIEVIIE